MTASPHRAPGGPAGAGGAPVLSARGLRKEFAGFVAVKDVDIDVRDGQIKALIGPNGAGKSTVFNLLTKFLPPTAGTDRVPRPGHHPPRPGAGRPHGPRPLVPDLGGLPAPHRARQRPGRAAAPAAASATSSGSASRALDRPERAAPASCSRRSASSDHRRHARAADLSYGRKRVLEIATTLALDPRVLLLDEPMAGMGHEDVGQVSRADRQRRRGTGRS